MTSWSRHDAMRIDSSLSLFPRIGHIRRVLYHTYSLLNPSSQSEFSIRVFMFEFPSFVLQNSIQVFLSSYPTNHILSPVLLNYSVSSCFALHSSHQNPYSALSPTDFSRPRQKPGMTAALDDFAFILPNSCPPHIQS